MPELKIPYARDDKQNIISPSEAKHNTAYNCECGNPVVLKAGKKKVWHFSHYSDNLNCKHAKDTIHSLAQFSLYESIKKAITDSKHIISIQLQCSYCENYHPQNLDLFEKQYQVDMEYGIETKKGFIRADIALIHPIKNPFVFEILNTSRVDEKKGLKCSSSGIASVEISAEDLFSKRYKRLEKFSNETNLTPLQQPDWIPPIAVEQCSEYLTPEQIEDKKKLDALNRTLRSNKEKGALALKLVKKYKEKEKKIIKEAVEIGIFNFVKTVILQEFGYEHIADLLPSDESGKVTHPINLLEHKINNGSFFFSRNPFFLEGEFWWCFTIDKTEAKGENILLIAQEINDLESLGFKVKVDESRTKASEETLDLIDDKRVKILKKRSCVESFEVDKAKELIPEYSSIARKLIAENLNKMKKNVNIPI